MLQENVSRYCACQLPHLLTGASELVNKKPSMDREKAELKPTDLPSVPRHSVAPGPEELFNSHKQSRLPRNLCEEGQDAFAVLRRQENCCSAKVSVILQR